MVMMCKIFAKNLAKKGEFKTPSQEPHQTKNPSELNLKGFYSVGDTGFEPVTPCL